MSFVPPSVPPKDPVSLTPEQIEAAKKLTLEMVSCMHPFPNRFVEWLVRKGGCNAPK